MAVSQMLFLNRVQFGVGALDFLAAEMEALAIRRPLIVADEGIVQLGLAERIGALAKTQLIYSAVPPNPTEASVLQALDVYKGYGCDGIIAVGGGSPIDLAKAVALLATHEPPLERYAMIYGGMDLIGPTVPIIAIPTTAGTGTEVGRGALIALASGSKLVFASRHLLPAVALCDPSLTLTLPARMTAATGMDAFSHCVEAYLSPRLNPPVDAIVIDGARRAWRSLQRAVESPSDTDARADMMMASIEGGLGFQKGLGAVHALSHPLGALSEVSLHHGTCNAVILPSVIRFNRSVAANRIEDLERALSLPHGLRLDQAIEERNERTGLPTSLRAMGVTPAMVPTLVRGALADHSRPTNPRDLDEVGVSTLYSELLA
ncbi:MAG: iron-containing alcohol dehydrogenase [Rhodospirillaceae bacterium]